MATPSRVGDQHRSKLEAAIALALLHTYRRHTEQAQKRLGLPTAADPSLAAQDRMQRFAHERAQLVQDGINTRLETAQASLPADATDADRQAAQARATREIDRYNTRTLIPFLASYAAHQALLDVYRTTPDPNGSGQMAADAHQWVWTQNTETVDDCTDAANASPAPLADLIALAGSEPPAHPNCQCSLDPVD